MPRREYPLRWAYGDRALWRGRCVIVEYVADDAALVTMQQLELGVPRWRCAIAPIYELDLRKPE